MTYKKIILMAAGALASASTLAGGVPSAKFAATYTDEASLSVDAFATCSTTGGLKASCHDDATDRGHTLAIIKVPQDKELLVGVSAEIGLSTFGAIKGKNGGSGTAVADAEAAVTIHACPLGTDGAISGDCEMAAPGPIKLSKRVQELSAKLGGVIEECTFTAVDPSIGDTTINIANDCTVNDEEIALLLDTTAAHHFNFVLPNMDQGEYELTAVFTTAASANVYLCDPQAYDFDDDSSDDYTTEGCDTAGEVAGTAQAASVINKSMVTVQTVRAAKGGIVDAELID